jgi:hypothetical protein
MGNKGLDLLVAGEVDTLEVNNNRIKRVGR